MNYVVVDFEWNQAMSSKSSVFNKLPIHLRGEIIEIGAVRLNEDMTAGEEFSVDIKPVYFKQIHYKVKKLTGFDRDRLENGVSFSEAFDSFRKWCGEDVTFLTWGCDDQGIFEQNIIIHDLDWDWIEQWVNLQLIFNLQTGGDRNQKSLASAMEHFGIEQTRIAHDALGDAYNTALVCSNLDMDEGMRLYPDAEKILSARMQAAKPALVVSQEDSMTIAQEDYTGFESKAAAFANPDVSGLVCPYCGEVLDGNKWVNQGDQRYMNIFTCESDGRFLARIKFRRDEDGMLWNARKLVYAADDSMEEFYRTKSLQARRRGRSHVTKRIVK